MLHTKIQPPNGSKKVRTIEMHTGGEPLRIILDGFPEIPGKTILEKRAWCRENLDFLRTTLMWEPRGHRDMYGAIITEPVTEDGDFGIIFLHNEGYSTMCGHAIIALARFAVDSGLKDLSAAGGDIRIDTPAGRVTATVHTNEHDTVVQSSFFNVPSFVLIEDESLDIKGLGRVHFDIAFGGAFYAFVDAQDLGLDLNAGNVSTLTEAGMKIKKAVMANFNIIHPEDPELGFLYGTIFTSMPFDYKHHSRHVCIFANGQLDRSATGTGVSARAAILSGKKEMAEGSTITIESITGTTMDVSISGNTMVDEYPAVIPRVSGSAFYTGTSEFWIDPNDPLGQGFFLYENK